MSESLKPVAHLFTHKAHTGVVISCWAPFRTAWTPPFPAVFLRSRKSLDLPEKEGRAEKKQEEAWISLQTV